MRTAERLRSFLGARGDRQTNRRAPVASATQQREGLLVTEPNRLFGGCENGGNSGSAKSFTRLPPM
jgi:hypothetical protein